MTTAINHKGIYRDYVGVDACMSALMRPALYGSYHHIDVVGKEQAEKTETYDVVGSLCENNDKFAVQRELPRIAEGDLLVIHDTGAHGHAMGFQYNGRLRPKELLLHADGGVELIRRAETVDGLFRHVQFPARRLQALIGGQKHGTGRTKAAGKLPGGLCASLVGETADCQSTPPLSPVY